MINWLQLEERHYLEHILEHFILDRNCKHCVVAAQNGAELEAVQRQYSSTNQERWRTSELDVYIEAIDSAIDFKQVQCC